MFFNHGFEGRTKVYFKKLLDLSIEYLNIQTAGGIIK